MAGRRSGEGRRPVARRGAEGRRLMAGVARKEAA
jgi:hypothetical protein